MDFLKFIPDVLYFVIPVLIFLGWCIKRIPQVPNQAIPFILIVLGIAFSCLKLGLTADAVGIGVLLAGVAVLGNQMWKQGSEIINMPKPGQDTDGGEDDV